MCPRILAALCLLTLSTTAFAVQPEPDAFDALPEDGLGEWNDELVRLVADGDVTLDRVERLEREDSPRDVFIVRRYREEHAVRHISCDELVDWMRAVATPEPIASGGYVYEWRYDQLYYRQVIVGADTSRAIECPVIEEEEPLEERGGDENAWEYAEAACSGEESQTLELIGPWVLLENGWSTYCGGIHAEHGASWSVAYVGTETEPMLAESVDVPSLLSSLKGPPRNTELTPPTTEPSEVLAAPHYFSGYDAARDMVEVTFGLTPGYCSACQNAPWPFQYEAKVTSPRLRRLLLQMYPVEEQ